MVIRLTPTSPQDVGQLECVAASPNSSGQPAVLEAYGAAALADRSLRLRVSALPQRTFGLFLASLTPGLVPAFGGGGGTLCLGGSIGRFDRPGEVRNGGLFGRASLSLNLDALPQPGGATSATSGSRWYFQYWYRDRVGGAATSNLSSAKSVTFQ